MNRRNRNPMKRLVRARDGQKGVAAMEFALIFPVVFALVYGMITYGLILMAEQSLTLAVGEGGRAAVRYSSTTDGPVAAACASVNASSSWLGANLMSCSAAASSTACPYAATTAKCLKITASYNYAANPFVPTLPLMKFVLPQTLTASTIVQLP